MYKINEFSKLTGVSKRTLRYYDEIGLLKPNYINDSNYRIYTSYEADIMQTILFYKELDYELIDIKKILTDDNFNIISSLKNHKKQLCNKRDRIDSLLQLVSKTIKNMERGIIMNDDSKFESFKRSQIEKNNKKYGEELNNTYGSETVKKSNQKYLRKSKYEIKEHDILTDKLNTLIKKVTLLNDVKSNDAFKMIELHKKWIMFYWPEYNIDAHYNLIKMYTEDERFKSYYDDIQEGSAEFMFEAVKEYIKKL